MRNIKEKEDWSGTIKAKSYSDLIFNELTVRNAEVNLCSFTNTRFNNCYLGNNSNYKECIFRKCRFYGKYSSLGAPVKYFNCRFEDCEFVGLDLLSGVHFYDCFFTGIMKNQIFNDAHLEIDNQETIFMNCDLKEVLFDNVNIYGKEVFRNTILPHKGIRLFNNDNNILLNRAASLLEGSTGDEKIDAQVLFNQNIRNGQNPIIFDEKLLESFFKTEKSKILFEEITEGFELKNSS